MKTHTLLSGARSFVCMTDIFFALSAGLLLLNALDPAPLDLTDLDAQQRQLLLRVEQAEAAVRDLETTIPTLQHRLQEVLHDH